jgi:hypothetical protein
MDRGIVVGGVLIGASFLLAVTLNRSAEKPVPAPAAVEQSCERRSPARSGPQRAQDDDVRPLDPLERLPSERACTPSR